MKGRNQHIEARRTAHLSPGFSWKRGKTLARIHLALPCGQLSGFNGGWCIIDTARYSNRALQWSGAMVPWLYMNQIGT